MMWHQLLCRLGVHRWNLVHRSFHEDKRYWESHGVLPEDVVVCERCGKQEVVNL